ncbi:MAG: sigma-54-dependent transcriptional regulator [Terriglobales bacterium]
MMPSAAAPALEPRAASPVRVLIVDDEPEKLGYVRALLEAHACAVEVEASGALALARVKRGPVPDLVLLDLMMPGQDGIATLSKLRRARPGLRVVMLSNLNDTRKAVEAAQLGAADYLTKPLKEADLKSLLGQAALAGSAAGPPPEADGDEEDARFVMISPAMQRVRQEALRVAPIDVPVLILGESGTGKEVVARMIHRHSPRAQGPFVKVNCAALPADLLESELFGFEAGAFTGAVRAKPGKFELGENGTILLDEIGEMPPALQAKLLHVLQDGGYSRLGSRKTLRADVRVLSATNIDVQRAIVTGQFRADLYYRLNAFTLLLPPLRERQEAIPVLLRQFMLRFAESYSRPILPITAAMHDACLRHPWPGNLREMENFVKRYLILGDEQQAIAELEQHAAALAATAAPSGSPSSFAGPAPRDLKSLVKGLKGEAEAEAIAQALRESRGVRKQAAQALGISYKALLYKIRMYGLEPE